MTTANHILITCMSHRHGDEIQMALGRRPREFYRWDRNRHALEVTPDEIEVLRRWRIKVSITRQPERWSRCWTHSQPTA